MPPSRLDPRFFVPGIGPGFAVPPRPSVAELVAGTSYARRSPSPIDLRLATLANLGYIFDGKRGGIITSSSTGQATLLDFTDEPVGSMPTRDWNGALVATEQDRMLLRYGGMGLDKQASDVPIRLGSGGTPSRTAGQAGAYATVAGIPEWQRITALGVADTSANWVQEVSRAYLRPMRIRGWVGRPTGYGHFGEGDASRYGLAASVVAPSTANSFWKNPANVPQANSAGIGLLCEVGDDHEVHLVCNDGVSHSRTATGIVIPDGGGVLLELAWDENYAYWRAWDETGAFLDEARAAPAGIPGATITASSASVTVGGYRATAGVAATYSLMVSAVEWVAGPRPGGWR